MEVKILINGEDIVLQNNGKTNTGTYQKFSEPEPYASMGLGRSPLIVSAFVRPDWKPSKGKTVLRRIKRHPKVRHPPVKSSDGKTLALSIRYFARNHNPPLKYDGMRTAVDALTASKSPSGDDYDFHYDVDYRRDGIYIEWKSGRGYRTLQEKANAMRAKAGF